MKRIKANKVITASQNIYNSDLYFSTSCGKHLLLRMFKFSFSWWS